MREARRLGRAIAIVAAAALIERLLARSVGSSDAIATLLRGNVGSMGTVVVPLFGLRLLLVLGAPSWLAYRAGRLLRARLEGERG